MSEEKKNDQTVEPAAPQERELPRMPDGTVDIDRIDLKLLIICSRRSGADTVATFLTRRGWETVVSTKLNDAFKWITTVHPDFVLLSVNFKSPKMNQLPGVLRHTFKTSVITFTEIGDPSSMRLMETTPADYKIHGSISGPALQRRMRQILQEIYRAEGTGKKSSIRMDENREHKELRRTLIQKGNPSEIKEWGNMVGASETESKDGKTGKRSSPRIEKNFNKMDLSKLAAEFSSQEEDTENGAVDDNTANKEEDSRFSLGEEPRLSEKKKEFQLQKTKDNGGEFTFKKEAQDADLLTTTRPEGKRGEGTSENTDDPNDEAEKLLETGKYHNLKEKGLARKKDYEEDLFLHSEVVASDLNGGKKSSQIVAMSKTELHRLSWTQILEKVVLDALSSSVTVNSDKSATARCLVQEVNVDNQTGHFVLYTNLSDVDRIPFESKVVSTLKEVGPKYFETFSIKDGQPIEIATEGLQVTFPGEIAHISVKNQPVEVVLKHSILREFIDLKVDTKLGKAIIAPNLLAADTPVGANLFLFLQLNKRFYCYVRAQACLTSKQITKLIETGTSLYLEPQDVDIFKETLTRMKLTNEIHQLLEQKKKSA